ncbi:MAG TPA: LLM class F420-dependent oxidoreductase [Acidimicrobiia bacterium]|nr:LLM class F420-dependent oxidoreductase [Acidimicrobiia bacterium]
MKLGVLPRFTRDVIVDPGWVTGFGALCEEMGVESVWGVEHVLVAQDYEPRYPYSADGRMPGNPETVMPDPLEWLAFFAASSETVRLGTSVLVLTLHSPVVIAKRVATLDALSRGRMMLGVGIGWQVEEFAAVGVPYTQRGPRLDEYIDALRALWCEEFASFDGRFVRFDRVSSLPKPAHPGGVPIVIGGSSEAAARRAGTRGDGFFPYVVSPDDFAARVADVRAAAVAAGRDPGAVELTVWPTSWRPGAALDVDLARRYADGGADRLVVSAQEAGGPALDDLRRFLGDYRERVLDRL